MANRSKAPKPPTPKQEAASENTSQMRLEELARTSTELARIVAKNSSAAPELLQELGSSSDDTTRKNVTSNPNTPTSVLLKLGAQFPGQLLENPVFSLLLLENPNLLADMPLATLRSLLKRDTLPESFLEWAAGSTDEGVLLAVAMNPKTPKSALSKLTQSRNVDVALAAKLHVNWAGEMSEGWKEAALAAMRTTKLDRNCDNEKKLWGCGLIADDLLPILNEEIRRSVAQNPDTPRKLLQVLARDEDVEVRRLVGLHLKTPEIALKYLAGDDVHERLVAYHPHISLTSLQEFQLQREAIENLDTEPDRLKELACSCWQMIRLGTAHHPKTPASVLGDFAMHQDWQFRVAVALNLSTPVTTLNQLAKDTDWEVRWGVAQNPNTPKTLLEQLAGDSHHLVRDGAEDYLSQPEIQKPGHFILYCPNLIPRDRRAPDSLKRMQILSTEIGAAHRIYEERLITVTQLSDAVQTVKSGNWQYTLCLVPLSTPVSILEQLACSDRIDVPLKVARHSNIPVSVLERLAGSEDTMVRDAVASNSRTPMNILLQLIQDNSDNVRDTAVENLRKHVLQNPNTPAETLQKLAYINDWRVRLAVARHPNTNAIALGELATEQDWKVRLLVAKHLNTPVEILEFLAEDKNLSVQKSALTTLYQRHPQPTSGIVEEFAAITNPDAPTDVLQTLASSSWLLIRIGTAKHPRTPASILEELAKDNHHQVRRAVARNHNTPASVLEKLLKDRDSQVSLAVVANPNTSKVLLERIAQKGGKNKSIQEAALKNLLYQSPQRCSMFLEKYAKYYKPSFTRLIVFLHPHAPAKLLAKNFRSSSWLERYAIAQNPNTPEVIRTRLAQDGNRIVRMAARANLQHTENSLGDRQTRG